MSLLAKINAALHGVLTGAGALWHEKLEPWFETLLRNVIHDEVKVLMPIAQAAAVNLVEKIPQSGSLSDFAKLAGAVLKATAAEAEKQAIDVATASLMTAVTAVVTPAVVIQQPDAEAEKPTIDETKTTDATA